MLANMSVIDPHGASEVERSWRERAFADGNRDVASGRHAAHLVVSYDRQLRLGCQLGQRRRNVHITPADHVLITQAGTHSRMPKMIRRLNQNANAGDLRLGEVPQVMNQLVLLVN